MNTRALSRSDRRKAKVYLSTQAKTFPPEMAKIAVTDWPSSTRAMPGAPIMVFRSRDFLATFYDDPNGYTRMSVQRVTTFTNGNWRDGILWDDLQRVKRECGFGGDWMVEVYPPDDELVNVANIRHLFLMREAPAFSWRNAR